MRDELLWLFFRLLFFQPGLVAVVLRRKTDLFFKQCAEGADAFKTYFVANFGNGLVVGQQVLCLVQPFLREVLVRRPSVNACEEPVKMEP